MFWEREANRDDPKWTDLARLAGGRAPVAVLGATGSVGQRFVQLLADHPWFEVRALTASESSAGKPYRDAVAWAQTTPLPPAIAALEVRSTDAASAAACRAEGCRLVFSALDPSVAGEAETAFAEAGCTVVSNARSHRMDPDVPLLVPEVNADHLALLRRQRFASGGAILTNPNCSTIGLVLALKPLVKAFGVARVHVVTMQALSGAGLPGVPAASAVDNLIPYIGGEEEKLETETRKILGRLDDGRIEEHEIAISAACNRVPVIDGHTLCVSVELEAKASPADLREAWETFSGQPQLLSLPIAPAQPVHYLDAPDAPQPRLHRDLERGMAITVGRLRPCNLFDYKFVTLSHNTLRGAAGGSLLVAELAIARGYVDGLKVEQ
jgi:aspartate-semialdehyde dehydrogenase